MLVPIPDGAFSLDVLEVRTVWSVMICMDLVHFELSIGCHSGVVRLFGGFGGCDRYLYFRRFFQLACYEYRTPMRMIA